LRDFQRYFRLKHSPVGVKFIFEHSDDMQEIDSEINDGADDKIDEISPSRFCYILRQASSGRRFIVSAKSLDCFGAEMSLGFIDPLNDKLTHAVVVEALKENRNYDVVVVIANPEEVMRISALYYQVTDERIRAEFKGDKAVCGEATAEVLKTGKPNISFLCHGAREYSEYLAEEVVIGFPFNTFKKIVDAILKKRVKSMCGCSMDDIPAHVVKKMRSLGFDKATDHFAGIFNKKIVKAYLLRDLSSITLFTSIKLRGENDGMTGTLHEKVNDTIYLNYSNHSNSIYLTKRGKWLDLSTTVEFNDVAREVLNKSFDEVLLSKADELVKVAEDLERRLSYTQ